MHDFLEIIRQNSGWLFGSTSAAALVLGILRLVVARKRKPDNGAKDSSGKATAPPPALTVAALGCGALAVAFGVVLLGSGSQVGVAHEGNVAQGDAQVGTVEGGNLIQSGDRSNNVIAEDSAVTISD